jgi:hypothetical protein
MEDVREIAIQLKRMNEKLDKLITSLEKGREMLNEEKPRFQAGSSGTFGEEKQSEK